MLSNKVLSIVVFCIFTCNVYTNGIENSDKVVKKSLKENLFSRDEIKNVPMAYNTETFHAKIKKGIIYRNRIADINLDNSNNASGRCEDCEGHDCTGYESWIGDGICDEGEYGMYFNCEEFNFDEGDCADDSGGDGGDGDDSNCDEIGGNESWLGDACCG